MSEITKYSIGIDVSKDKLHACFSEINSEQRVKVKSTCQFSNNKKGFFELEKWVKKHQKESITMVLCMEATGVYYEKIAFYLYKKNYAVVVILPSKAKKYIQATGIKTKNDKVDSTGIARMGAEQHLELWKPMEDFFYKLRQMTRHHEQLQKSKTVLLNQLHALEHNLFEVKEVIKQQKKMIALVDKQIMDIIKVIERHIKSNIEVERKINNICKIKGVGILSIATILAETNGFELFKNISQLVSYAGYDVVENQSGKHVGKTKISKKGNSHIRRILHLPAFTTVRYKQAPFSELYNRVFERTKRKMKAYVAVQKKILIYIYTLWKRDVAYNPNYNKTSGNDEPKPLFLQGSERAIDCQMIENKVVPVKTETTQDELPCNESPEALFLQGQN